MNAVQQRRLTPGLVVLCALAVLLLVATALGLGRSVHWNAHGLAAKLPAASAAVRRHPPPLQHYSTAWQKPLFNDQRKPVMESDDSGAQVKLGDLQLTGIIMTPDLHMALLRDRSGHGVRVLEGASLPESGWTLHKLAARSAVFTGNGQRTELKLKVAPEIDPNAGPGPPEKGDASAKGMAPMRSEAGGKAGSALKARKHVRGARQSQQNDTHEDEHGKKSGLRLSKPSKGSPQDKHDQAARQAAGQREKEQRIKALKARIESRRRQMKAQHDQEH